MNEPHAVHLASANTFTDLEFIFDDVSERESVLPIRSFLIVLDSRSAQKHSACEKKFAARFHTAHMALTEKKTPRQISRRCAAHATRRRKKTKLSLFYRHYFNSHQMHSAAANIDGACARAR